MTALEGLEQDILLLGSALLFLFAVAYEQKRGNYKRANGIVFIEFVLLVAFFWGVK